MTHEDRMFLLGIVNANEAAIGESPRDLAKRLLAQEVGRLVAQAERKPKAWVRKRPRVTNLK